ncbi:MAG: glycoside hydrolase family 3 C-terminal domain-containing protein [Fibrobacterales bacterium]
MKKLNSVLIMLIALFMFIVIQGCGDTGTQVANESSDDGAESSQELESSDAGSSNGGDEDSSSLSKDGGSSEVKGDAGDSSSESDPQSSSIVEKGSSDELSSSDEGISSDDEPESSDSSPKSAFENNDLDPAMEKLIEDKLVELTLEEKVGQMIQIVWYHTNKIGSVNDIKDYNIGSIIHASTEDDIPGNSAGPWSDKFAELQGIAAQSSSGLPLLVGIDAVHGNAFLPGSVVFPHQVGLGGMQDLDMAYEIAKITAIETRAAGINWTFAPVATVSKNERWGRVYEAFGETEEIVTPRIEATVNGLQNGGLTNSTAVASCVKHFFGDGITENGSERGSATISQADIDNIFMPPYQKAVDVGVASVMAAFNEVNGERMHVSKKWLTDVLKGEMEYKGVIVSDWEGYVVGNGTLLNAVNAGIDMLMAANDWKEGSSYIDIYNALLGFAKDGSVSEGRINDAVTRILRMKFRLGLLDGTDVDASLADKVGSAEHRAVAREAVAKTMVVTKNEGDVLPLSKDAKIAVVGAFADNSGLQSGGWTRFWQGSQEAKADVFKGELALNQWVNYDGATTILEGIKEVAPGATIVEDLSGIGKDADVAIVVIGEAPYAEWFGDDYRCDDAGTNTDPCSRVDKNMLVIPQDQLDMIAAYNNKGIPVVTVLISGRAMLVKNAADNSDGFVVAWLPGSEGAGVADILFGDVSPTAKLSHSFAKSFADVPINKGDGKDALWSVGDGLAY